MVSLKNTLLASSMMLVGAAASAHAAVYTIDVYTGNIGYSFDAVTSSAALFTAAANSQHAEFTYTGSLNFSDIASQNATSAGDLNSVFFGANAAGISGYTAITTLAGANYGSFATLSSFLAASGSVAGYGYGSLYIITDATSPTKGLNLTLTHDDGVGVYAGGALQPGTVTGPTAAVTETVTLPTGPGYTLAYSRENGTPSILTVAVPEPMSLTLMGAGLIGLRLVRRRRA